MKKGKRIVSVIIIAVLMLSMAGCVAEVDNIENNDFTIGVVIKAKDGEYWMSYISGMNKAAQDYNVNVVLLSPKTENENEVQKKMIEDMLMKDIDAIAISPIDSHETSYLSTAKERDIPVYATDSNYFDSDVPYIGYDNHKLGESIAVVMNDYMDGEGSVGVVSGSLNQAGHKSRVDGFCEYIEENSDIKVSFIIDGYSNLMLPEAEITELLDNNPEVKGVFVTNAVAALGLSDYLVKQEKDIVICAIDAQQDALEAVRKGRILALANHSGYDNGYYMIERIVSDVEGGEIKGDTVFEAEVLTKENVDSYNLPED